MPEAARVHPRSTARRSASTATTTSGAGRRPTRGSCPRGRESRSISRQYCGFSASPGSDCLVRVGELLPPARDAAAPRGGVGTLGAGLERGSRALTSSSITSRQSPTMGTSGRRTLPCSAGSMSTWMTLASGAKLRHLAGDPVVEPGAEGDQQVGPLQRRDGRGVAVHAGHAEAQRVVVGERAPGHQRRDDVDVGQLGQLPQRLGGAGLEDAAADVEHRALRGQDEPGRLLDHAGMALGVRSVARERVGDRHVARPVPLHRGLQHVLRHVDEHRPGSAGRGDVERLADGQRQVLGASSPARCAW